MNQSRRSFLKFGGLVPAVAAAPLLGTSAWALAESNRASNLLQQIHMTKDQVMFKDCAFEVGKDFVLRGNGQTLIGCHISGLQTGVTFLPGEQPTKLMGVYPSPNGDQQP